MSRIGRQPIEIPSGVTVEVSPGGNVTVSGSVLWKLAATFAKVGSTCGVSSTR